MAFMKCSVPDGCDRVGDGDRGQPAEARKSRITNGSDGVGNGDNDLIADVCNQGVSIGIRVYKITISNAIH